MGEIILPVDVEQAAIDELAGLVQAATKIPAGDTKPSTFARVVSAGGVPETIVSDAYILTVEVYALKESAAQKLAAQVLARLSAAALRGRMGSEVCYRVGVAALPQNYPNPTVPGYARYTMTLEPVLRRRTITT